MGQGIMVSLCSFPYGPAAIHGVFPSQLWPALLSPCLAFLFIGNTHRITSSISSRHLDQQTHHLSPGVDSAIPRQARNPFVLNFVVQNAPHLSVKTPMRSRAKRPQHHFPKLHRKRYDMSALLYNTSPTHKSPLPRHCPNIIFA